MTARHPGLGATAAAAPLPRPTATTAGHPPGRLARGLRITLAVLRAALIYGDGAQLCRNYARPSEPARAPAPSRAPSHPR